MTPDVLTVTLNPAIDKIITVRNFKTQADSRVESQELRAGGKGINAARTLKILGCPSLALGFSGGASGKFLEQQLAKENLPFDFIPTQAQTRTNLTILDRSRKQTTRLLEPGGAVLPSEWKAFQKKLITHLKKARFVIFSGSLPPGLNENIYAELIKLARRNQVLAALDTSSEFLKQGIKARPFLLKPNQPEAEEYWQRNLKSWSRRKEAVIKLQATGIGWVVLSLGARGILGCDGQTILRVQSRVVEQGSEVGCGDSLLAGLVFQYVQHQNFVEALKWGVACGTAQALQRTGGALDRLVVEKFLREVKIREV